MGDRTGLTKLDRTNGYEDGRGYMQAKKSKLADQNDQIREALRNRNKSMRTDLFKGISINVNGRTQPTADELKRLILLNGGEYHPYYRYQLTKFMIATNLSSARIKQLRPDDRIVKPEWITDSIQAKCLLPYQDYQLFMEEPRNDSDTSNLDQHFAVLASKQQKKLQITSAASNSNNSKPITLPQESRNSQPQQPTTSKPKPATMNDFVIRGAKPKRFNTPKVGEQKKYVANICGQTNLDDIINLLNEWVGCPEGITDEDTACVTKYFYDLMAEKDYHNKFYEIINSFQTRIIEHGEDCWTELYNNLMKDLKNELNHNAETSQSLCELITLL